MRRRRLANGLFRVLPLLLLAAGVGGGGCAARAKAPADAAVHPAPKPPPPPKPKPPVDAWIDASNFCTLPLSTPDVPPTGAALAESMMAGFRPMFSIPDPAAAVTIVGGRYPAVDTMRVDLSGAVATPGDAGRGGRRPTTKPAVEAGGLTIRDFSLVGEPIVNRRSRVNFLVTGTDVRFGLRKENDKAYLLMTDAAAGTLHFDVAVSDLERMLTGMAKEQGKRKGLFVQKVELNLKNAGGRSLDAELYVHTLVGFLPAGMKFACRVDVDDAMNATIRDLTVEGDDLLGPLITAFLRPSLKKYDGKTKPIISFPGDIRLRDVQITGGERISLDAVFGR